MFEPEVMKSGELTFHRGKFADKWVCYAHSINGEKTYFYVGVCKLIDIYEFADAFRNSHWRKTVTADMPLTVKVLASADSMVDAQKAQRQAYDAFRPPANVGGYQMTRQVVVTCVQGDNMGKTYESASQCAIENGITAGALSNHLNGRRGYDNVRGMRFKRGM